MYSCLLKCLIEQIYVNYNHNDEFRTIIIKLGRCLVVSIQFWRPPQWRTSLETSKLNELMNSSRRVNNRCIKNLKKRFLKSCLKFQTIEMTWTIYFKIYSVFVIKLTSKFHIQYINKLKKENTAVLKPCTLTHLSHEKPLFAFLSPSGLPTI